MGALLLFALNACILHGQAVIDLPDTGVPTGRRRFEFDAAGERRAQWSVGGLRRAYFEEDLPALFSRTIALDEPLPEGSSLDWIFTGPEGGVTVRLENGRAKLTQRYYDSYGHFQEQPAKARYPNRVWQETEVLFRGALRTVEVVMDHRLSVALVLSGKPVARQRCLMEMRRHQAAWTPPNEALTGRFAARMLEPPAVGALVAMKPARRTRRSTVSVVSSACPPTRS